MDRLLFFASVLAWATAGLALPAAVDAAECIRGANGCQFQESLNSASKPSTSLEGQLAGGTLGHLPLQQQDDPPRSQSNVQDGNTVHVKNHASLRRRTNEPPRKLSQAEWNDKRSRALTQLLEALERDDALLGRMAKVLGVPRARMHEMSFNHAEINNALRQAKYTGDLLPEEHELESRPQRDRRRPSTEDMSQEFRQESARVARLVLSDPEFLRKFRESLGLQPEGGWPGGARTPAEWNEALRKAGWEGPFLPETYSFSRVSPLASVKSVLSQALFLGRRYMGGGLSPPSSLPIRSQSSMMWAPRFVSRPM